MFKGKIDGWQLRPECSCYGVVFLRLLEHSIDRLRSRSLLENGRSLVNYLVIYTALNLLGPHVQAKLSISSCEALPAYLNLLSCGKTYNCTVFYVGTLIALHMLYGATLCLLGTPHRILTLTYVI